jgi:hypothetical protein
LFEGHKSQATKLQKGTKKKEQVELKVETSKFLDPDTPGC